MKKFLYILILLYSFAAKAQNFTQKSDFPDTARVTPFSFTLGNKIYLGAGLDSFSLNSFNTAGYRNELWMYNTSTDTWTQKKDLPFSKRCYAVATVINGIAYAGFGIDTSITTQKDWWQYNEATDTWTQKASLPGEARHSPAIFSWAGKAYILGGQTYNYSIPNPSFHPLKDLWAYDPIADSWAQEPDFTGAPRSRAICEVKDDTLYFGLGLADSSNTYYADVYKYNLVTKVWSPIAPIPPTTNLPVVDGWVSYTVLHENKIICLNMDPAIVVPDDLKTIYVYNIPTNTWTLYPLANTMGFRLSPGKGKVGDKAFMMTGWDYYNHIWLNDTWEINLQKFITGIENTNPELANIHVSSFAHTVNTAIPSSFLNKGNMRLEIYNLEGKQVRDYILSTENRFNLDELPSGNYAYRVSCGGNYLKTGILSLN